MSPTAEAEARSSEQIKEEVKRSVEAKTEAQLNQEFVRAMDEAQALEELLNTEVEHNPHSTGNAVYEKPENLTKGTTVKKAVLETVVAIQEGKVTVGDPTANEVLKSIANLTLDKINERTAPYLYRIIQRAKQNRFRTGNDIVEALGEIRNLKKVSYGLYQTLDRRLRDRLASMEPDQERRGKILERLDTMLQREREAQPAANAETTQTPADTVNEKRERNGFNNFLRYYGQYFTEKEDIELVEAIFDPEGKFVELLQSIKDEVGPNGKDVSNRLELKVVGLFSKLFAKVDRSNPEEFFENVIQQDPQRGIQSTFLSLRNALDSLYTHYQSKGGSDQRVRESLGIEAFNKRVNFIKDSHIEVELDVPETDTEGNVIPTGAVDEHGKQILQMKKVKRPYVVLDPTRRNTKASLAELIQHVGMTVDNEFNVRSYTHNVSAILYRNAPDAEKGGFYGQLAGYASKMKGRNLDAMFALPDADIVAQAHRLYNKYLTEEFAKNDWRHNVPLFHRDAVHRTKVQNEIIAALKGMYMDGTRVKTSEQWRLDRALDIAIGQARGVTMDETELAAYADPQMDPDGKGPYYGDYYPNVAALEHFNYAHATYRWQSEGAMPPMLFFPVESADGKPLIFKNHEQYLDYMTKYRDSFLKGNKDIKGVKLIADFLMNPGNIGSFVKRGDWRFLEAYKGYFENPTLKGVDKKNINHLTNWKTIENIGYEVLLTYREHIMNDEFIKGNPAKRDELFEYLMEKYIRPTLPPGENNISLEEYKHRVEHMLHEEHEHAPKGHGHGGHGHGVSEMDVYRRILNRALAGVAATRFGSKFAKFERDRFNSDGKRTWQEIRESIGWAHAEMQLGSVALYDAAMKDISIAETMLRKEKTEEMRRIVDNGGTLDEANMLYMMTREKIIEYLNAQGKKDEEIQRALDVFEKIQKRCTQNEKFLTDFTKNIIEDRKFSFSWGTEELELSFLSFSNVGDKMLGRTVGDIATIEREITGRIYAYFDALHATATSGEEKYDKLLEQLTPMKRALRDMHGPDYANKVIHHLAVMTIGYFKRDENAQGLHEISNIKQVNSLAAKYAGESTSVWEWRKPEIDAFIHELSAKQILNEVGYEMNKDSKDIHIQERTFETLENTIFKDVNLHDPESVKKHPILSKLKKALSWKSRGHDYDYSAHMLREEFHVTKGEMLTQSVLKAIGIMFLLALILTLKKAFEDFKSDGGGGGGGGGHGNGGGHH